MTQVNAFQRFREALPFLQEAERLGLKEARQAVALCQRVMGKQ